MAFLREDAGGGWGSRCYGSALPVPLRHRHHVSIEHGDGGIAPGWKGQEGTEWRDLDGSRP